MDWTGGNAKVSTRNAILQIIRGFYEGIGSFLYVPLYVRSKSPFYLILNENYEPSFMKDNPRNQARAGTIVIARRYYRVPIVFSISTNRHKIQGKRKCGGDKTKEGRAATE